MQIQVHSSYLERAKARFAEWLETGEGRHPDMVKSWDELTLDDQQQLIEEIVVEHFRAEEKKAAAIKDEHERAEFMAQVLKDDDFRQFVAACWLADYTNRLRYLRKEIARERKQATKAKKLEIA